MRRATRWILAALGLGILGLALWCLVPVAPTIPAMRPGPETSYWEMSGGYRIAYTRVAAAGESRGLPIVYLHGGPGGYVHSSVRSTLGALAESGHDIYFYDQVGSGLSDRLARPKDYSFLGHVADLAEIANRFLGGRVVLVGHSYGGMVAAEMVALHPEMVDRLVLSSPGELAPALFDEAGRWINEAKYVAGPELHFRHSAAEGGSAMNAWPLRAFAAMALATAFNVKLMPDAEADGVLNTLAAGFTKEMVCDPAHLQREEGGAGFYAHGWSNWFGDLEDPRPLLRRATLPVLVLQGECDHLPYAATYEYVDVFPHARYRYFPGAGHILLWDKPREYFAAIAEFLAED